jgi:hypothetical protein
MPVDDRVIETDAQALGAEGVGDFPDQIPVEDVAGVGLGEFGIVGGESIVVFGGENDVLASRLFGEGVHSFANPGAGLNLGMVWEAYS